MERIETVVPPPRPDKTSVLVRGLLRELSGPAVTVGDVVDSLGRRSFGGLIFAATAFLILPGISVFAAFVLIFLAAQMAAGRRAPVLPGAVLRRRIPADRLRAYCERAVPGIEFIERFVRPRWLFLTLPPMPALLGVVVVLLALTAMLPVPLIQLPPAFAIMWLSLGLLERDGVMIAIGLALGLAAVALFIGVSHATVDAVWPFVDDYMG